MASGVWNVSSNLSLRVACGGSALASHPLLVCVYSLVFAVSLLLNAVAVRVFFCRRVRVRSSITVYMRNLAAADFLLSLCLPLRIANYSSRSPLTPNIYCSFGATAFYLNMYASILFMNLIAANRYLKIVRPLQTHALQTVGGARRVSALTWLSLLALSSVYLIIFLGTSWGGAPDPERMGCEALHSAPLSAVYKATHCVSMLLFLLVLVSLVLLYWATLRRVRRAQAAAQASRSSRQLSASARNMLVLVLVFCVCFVPYHAVRLPYALAPPLRRGCGAQVFYVVKELTVLLSVLNACLDPFIYLVFCKAFRAQLGLGGDSSRPRPRRTSQLLSYAESVASQRRHATL